MERFTIIAARRMQWRTEHTQMKCPHDSRDKRRLRKAVQRGRKTRQCHLKGASVDHQMTKATQIHMITWKKIRISQHFAKRRNDAKISGISKRGVIMSKETLWTTTKKTWAMTARRHTMLKIKRRDMTSIRTSWTTTTRGVAMTARQHTTRNKTHLNYKASPTNTKHRLGGTSP